MPDSHAAPRPIGRPSTEAGREPALFYAIPLFLAVVAALMALPDATYLHSGWRRWIQIAATLWVVASLYVWAVPSWRDRLLARGSGQVIFGFVGVTALALSLATVQTPAALPSLFVIRVLLLGAPFAVARLLRLEAGRPHWWDALVFLYAFLLVRYGWLDVHVAGAMEPPTFRINLGYHGIVALIATYYFGVRRWATVATDWRLKAGDYKAAALALAVFLAVGLPYGWFAGLLAPHDPPLSVGYWLLTVVYLLGFVAVIEEYVFRGVLLVGLRSLFPRGLVGDLAAVIIAAVLFGLLHFAGPLYTIVVIWLGAVLGWTVLRTRRLVQSMLIHGGLIVLVNTWFVIITTR